MWGWLTSIVNWLGDIAEGIISLPIKLIEGLLNGIKEIFIPDVADLKNTFNATIDNIASIIGLPIDSIQDAFESVGEQPVADIKGDYNIPGVGTFNVTFFDTTFFRKGIDYFRPIIRGFIVLALFFYNYRQVMTFIGQDPGVYGIAKDNADYHLWRRKEDEE